MGTKMLPPHPGTTLKEVYLDPLGLTPTQLAKAIKVPPSRITNIVNGRTAVTVMDAMRFTRYFGGTHADTMGWLTAQALYDFKMIERQWWRKIEREVKPRAAQLAEEQEEAARSVPTPSAKTAT